MLDKLKKNGVSVEKYHLTKFGGNNCFSLCWRGALHGQNIKPAASKTDMIKNAEI